MNRKLHLSMDSIGVLFEGSLEICSLEGTCLWNRGLALDVFYRQGHPGSLVQWYLNKAKSTFLKCSTSFTSRNTSLNDNFISASDFFSIPNAAWNLISLAPDNYLRFHFAPSPIASIRESAPNDISITNILTKEQFISKIKSDPHFIIKSGYLNLMDTQNGVQW